MANEVWKRWKNKGRKEGVTLYFPLDYEHWTYGCASIVTHLTHSFIRSRFKDLTILS